MARSLADLESPPWRAMRRREAVTAYAVSAGRRRSCGVEQGVGPAYWRGGTGNGSVTLGAEPVPANSLWNGATGRSSCGAAFPERFAEDTRHGNCVKVTP